jgi:hypothetical protein
LRADDVILSVEGRLTREMNDLASALQGRAPGARISLTLMRDQEERTVAVTLGRRPPTTDGPALISPQTGPAPNIPNAASAQRPLTDLLSDPSRPPAVRGESARLDLLERRMAELERRLAELERLLSRGP